MTAVPSVALRHLRMTVMDMVCLMDESAGVDGLHLNGDLATWDELSAFRQKYNEARYPWLQNFDDATRWLESLVSDEDADHAMAWFWQWSNGCHYVYGGDMFKDCDGYGLDRLVPTEKLEVVYYIRFLDAFECRHLAEDGTPTGYVFHIDRVSFWKAIGK